VLPEVVVAVAGPVSDSVAVSPPAPLIFPEILNVCTVDVKFTAVTLLPFRVTFRLAGVKVNPDLLGVTVYVPFPNPPKL
jgi:hypothetical protein